MVLLFILFTSIQGNLNLKSKSRMVQFEEEKPAEVDSLPRSERHKRISHLLASLFQAAAEGAVRIKRRKDMRRGVKADFLLMVLSLNRHLDLSWPCGRWLFFRGYHKKFRIPEASRHGYCPSYHGYRTLYCAMGWPGEIYIVSILVGLGYGASCSL